MYSYVINDTKSEAHFNKTNDLTELRDDLQNEAYSNSIRHAYRIEDLTRAINTSVLLDADQKNQYNELLTNDAEQFDAGDEFVDICKEVGECDVT